MPKDELSSGGHLQGLDVLHARGWVHRDHDRNPVILPVEMWLHWIDPTVVGDQALVGDVVAADVAEAPTLEAYEVAKLPFRADGPELTQPFETHG